MYHMYQETPHHFPSLPSASLPSQGRHGRRLILLRRILPSPPLCLATVRAARWQSRPATRTAVAGPSPLLEEASGGDTGAARERRSAAREAAPGGWRGGSVSPGSGSGPSVSRAEQRRAAVSGAGGGAEGSSRRIRPRRRWIRLPWRRIRPPRIQGPSDGEPRGDGGRKEAMDARCCGRMWRRRRPGGRFRSSRGDGRRRRSTAPVAAMATAVHGRDVVVAGVGGW
uniref:Uncharacterized protein n=1 Tax=Oryza nivara TaxID=4536 RepID=A0A0E0H0X9_ORYNI